MISVWPQKVKQSHWFFAATPVTYFFKEIKLDNDLYSPSIYIFEIDILYVWEICKYNFKNVAQSYFMMNYFSLVFI